MALMAVFIVRTLCGHLRRAESADGGMRQALLATGIAQLNSAGKRIGSATADSSGTVTNYDSRGRCATSCPT